MPENMHDTPLAFFLPLDRLIHFDDPGESAGDDGWNLDALRTALSACGQMDPLEVGHLADTDDDPGLYVFQGNHRLQAMRCLDWKAALCTQSPSDFARPLRLIDIARAGGWLYNGAAKTPGDPG